MLSGFGALSQWQALPHEKKTVDLSNIMVQKGTLAAFRSLDMLIELRCRSCCLGGNLECISTANSLQVLDLSDNSGVSGTLFY